MHDGINRRFFPRRKLDLSFDLIINGEAVPAVVIDYSLSGMAILIRGKSDLDSPLLDLKISDINLNATGKIIWKREMFAGLKVGVGSIGPLQGMLGYYRLSDIAGGIERARKTGVLSIETEQCRRKVFFKDGAMVFSSSDQAQEQLGAMLLATGKLSPQQYQNALSIERETGKSQGAVLVEMQQITPQELIQAVHQNVESVIMNICNVEDAKFIFREEALPRGESITLKLNANDLLYRGSRNAECIEAFKNRYLRNPAKLTVAVETNRILERLVLEAQDREILSLIVGKTSLNELLSLSPLKAEETLRSLYALFNAQLIELEVSGLAKEESQGQETAEEEAAIDPAIAAKIDTLYREHKTLGYQGVLGLLPNASSREIKLAYLAMAKEYHPDRYLLIKSAKLKEKLNTVFRYINEAYRELSRTGVIRPEQTQASDVQQETSGMDNKTMAQERYHQGRKSISSNEYENAMTLFGQAVYLDNLVPEYHYYYGICLLRNKKIKEAEASIRRALHLSPDNADYFAELGHIYLQLGFMTRAKNAFAKVLELNPSQIYAAEGMKKILEQQEA